MNELQIFKDSTLNIFLSLVPIYIIAESLLNYYIITLLHYNYYYDYIMCMTKLQHSDWLRGVQLFS